MKIHARKSIKSLYAGVLVVIVGVLGACSGSQESAKDDVSAPPDQVVISTVAGVGIPVSRVDGPTESDPARGYAHSPQGAALAAVNGQARLAVARDDEWTELVRSAFAPSKGRDQYVNARLFQRVDGTVSPEVAPVFRGFKVTSYTPEKAIVVLAFDAKKKDAPPTLVAYPVQLVWEGGDWRIVLPTQADGIDTTALKNLDGFTPFTKG